MNNKPAMVGGMVGEVGAIVGEVGAIVGEVGDGVGPVMIVSHSMGQD